MMNKLAAALAVFTAAGCATETDGALTITGRLHDASRVTHVIATNPTTGDRIVVDMKSDGRADGYFQVDVPAGGAWIVTFADASKKGAAMRIATLQTSGIDAFTSKSGGSLDFGTVKFSGARAHGELTWEALTGATGYDRDTLVKMGKRDNLALRYANPDVDGDGEIDALQGRDYRLELAGTYRLQQDGVDLGIVDLVRGASQPSVRYTGTAIQAAVPSEMDMNMFSGTVAFDQPFYGTAMGPQTEMIAPGTRIGQPHVKFGELAGDPLLGVVARGDADAPSGNYNFGFDNGQLSFSDVFAPSSATLAAATDYAVPFMRIRPVVEGCLYNCEIEAVDIEWKRQTEGGWVATDAPSDAKLDVVANFNGKRTSLTADFAGATSLAWNTMPVKGTGLLRTELSYISTAEICYVAVSYSSELGMKMTSQVENPGCF